MEHIKIIKWTPIIAPEHNRTSCSDENIDNGFYIDESTENDVEKSCVCTVLVLDSATGNYPIWVESEQKETANT